MRRELEAVVADPERGAGATMAARLATHPPQIDEPELGKGPRVSACSSSIEPGFPPRGSGRRSATPCRSVSPCSGEPATSGRSRPGPSSGCGGRRAA